MVMFGGRGAWGESHSSPPAPAILSTLLNVESRSRSSKAGKLSGVALVERGCKEPINGQQLSAAKTAAGFATGCGCLGCLGCLHRAAQSSALRALGLRLACSSFLA